LDDRQPFEKMETRQVVLSWICGSKPKTGFECLSDPRRAIDIEEYAYFFRKGLIVIHFELSTAR